MGPWNPRVGVERNFPRADSSPIDGYFSLNFTTPLRYVTAVAGGGSHVVMGRVWLRLREVVSPGGVAHSNRGFKREE